jgi:hypothetical protein
MVVIACHQDIWSAIMPPSLGARHVQLALTRLSTSAYWPLSFFVECHEDCKHAAIPNHLHLVREFAQTVGLCFFVLLSVKVGWGDLPPTLAIVLTIKAR